MPVYNITISDSSPLITYSENWTDSSSVDPLRSAYADFTFHATQELGAAAKFTFNGTGIYLFGARRDNHGQYGVSIDGAPPVVQY